MRPNKHVRFNPDQTSSVLLPINDGKTLIKQATLLTEHTLVLLPTECIPLASNLFQMLFKAFRDIRQLLSNKEKLTMSGTLIPNLIQLDMKMIAFNRIKADKNSKALYDTL